MLVSRCSFSLSDTKLTRPSRPTRRSTSLVSIVSNGASRLLQALLTPDTATCLESSKTLTTRVA